MDLKLSGRTALVTGSSKGIGLSVAQWLAREGVHVFSVGRSDREGSRRHPGVNARALAADLSSAAARERIAHAFPDIDILVNNAGAIPGGSIDQVYEPAWCAGWDLKVYGYIGLTRLYNAALFEKNERTAQRRYH
jgi:3-oxoacyl-[acyl-carrier protein] reductase